MTYTDTALATFSREYTRLYAWAAAAVDEWSAHQVCYTAFSSLMWSGVSGRHTSKGTVAGLYMAAEPPLRRAIEVRGGYLAAGAWKRAPWPSYDEALELAALYSAWVYVHIAADFGWHQRIALADALRAYRSGRMLIPTGSRAAAEDALIVKVLSLAASYLSPSVPLVERAADRAREVWDRERYRTAATYRSRGSLVRSAANGDEQQADDPGVSSTPRTDPELAGLWAVRRPGAVAGVGLSPEPTADERDHR